MAAIEAVGGSHRRAFVSGQEQQIFLPDLPRTGAAAGAVAAGDTMVTGSVFETSPPISRRVSLSGDKNSYLAS